MILGLTTEMPEIKAKFDRAAWRKNHLAKKAACKLCGSVVCKHTMSRHQKTMKCFSLRFAKFSFRDY